MIAISSKRSVRERLYSPSGVYIVGSDDPNDFIDAVIESLRNDSPGRECFTEDDVRAALVEVIENGENE